jgi:hypothetical protein
VLRRIKLILADRSLAVIKSVSERLRKIKGVIPKLLGASIRDLLELTSLVAAISCGAVGDLGRTAE